MRGKVVGEGGRDEDTVIAERLLNASDSEREELLFMQSVMNVTRNQAAAARFAIVPTPRRFKTPRAPDYFWNIPLGIDVMKFGEGVSFSLESLRRKDENGSWFVPAMNKLAITYRYDILEREPEALKNLAKAAGD